MRAYVEYMVLGLVLRVCVCVCASVCVRICRVERLIQCTLSIKDMLNKGHLSIQEASWVRTVISIETFLYS